MTYTAEEIRARLDFVISDREPRILTWKSGGCHPASIAECALWDALAERIEADESAVPVGYVMDDTATGHKFGLLTQDLPPNTKLFVHPPAQATQVEDKDMDAQLTVMIEHLTSIVESQAAEPVAQPANSGQVPDGWVLVPREPTTAILEALESTQQNTEAGSLYNSVDCWEAMLEAAIRGKPS